MTDHPYRPYTLVAELTYRCPLQCAYCSNPVELSRHPETLDAAAWQNVFAQAAALGVVQLHLTGGEPLLRQDLTRIVAHARAADLYTHLVTSGIPATRERLRAVREAGLDAVQLSLQDSDPAAASVMTGADAFSHKRQVATWLRELDLPLTINVVLHRHNIDRVDAIIDLAESLDAERLELANAQYLGWALLNRHALLPSREQLERARAIALRARSRLRGRMEVTFVLPDYHAGVPRACMDGWGRRFMVITPNGLVLPCHAAHTIEGLTFPRVTEQSLATSWHDAPGLNAFRGQAWMRQPCRSCDRRHVDFGGCRCQAYHLTGEAAAADPACALSPDHGAVRQAHELAYDVPASLLRQRRARRASRGMPHRKRPRNE